MVLIGFLKMIGVKTKLSFKFGTARYQWLNMAQNLIKKTIQISDLQGTDKVKKIHTVFVYFFFLNNLAN